MKLLFILLALVPFVAFAADRCVVGSISRANLQNFGARSLTYSDCPSNFNTCFRYLDATNIFVMGCETNAACEARRNAGNVTEAVCCDSDICNPPPDVIANKDAVGISHILDEMRSIMYTVMGSIFMVLWLVLAFLLGAIPSFVLVVLGLLDVIFGYFLIFIPAAHYLGLYFILLGVATIAAELHLKDSHTHRWIILGAVVGFLLIAGLTFIPFTTTPFIERVAASNCVGDLGLDYDPENRNPYRIGYPTRCENYLLYVLFCVYLLLLLQPLKVILAFKHAAHVVHDDVRRVETTTETEMRTTGKKAHQGEESDSTVH